MRWNSKRYMGDSEELVVHDRLTHRCGKDVLLGIVRRGAAVGFGRDTLASALEWGYRPCPRCVPGCAKPRLEIPKPIPLPPAPPRPLPPLALVPASLDPRGPILSAGNAVSMEKAAAEELQTV